MRRAQHITFILAAYTLLSGCSSPTYLRDPSTGAVYGPVHPAARATIHIGEDKFEILTAGPRNTKMFRVLTSHFPSYDFRGCSLLSAIDEMNRMIKMKFPKSNVEIRLLSDTFRTEPSPFEPESRSYVPKITFVARDVPLMTAIDILCRTSGSQFLIEESTVTISAEDVQQKHGP